MKKIINDQPDSPSRRNFIRHSSLGLLLLTTGSHSLLLGGCTKTDNPPQQFTFALKDKTFFAALLPAIIDDSLIHKPRHLQRYIDHIELYIATLPPVNQQEFQDLLTILHSPVRGLVTGVWTSWENTTPQQVNQFLERWRTSSIQLFKKAYSSLLNLSLMKWYDLPIAWPAINYPGPPYQSHLVTPPNHY